MRVILLALFFKEEIWRWNRLIYQGNRILYDWELRAPAGTQPCLMNSQRQELQAPLVTWTAHPAVSIPPPYMVFHAPSLLTCQFWTRLFLFVVSVFTLMQEIPSGSGRLVFFWCFCDIPLPWFRRSQSLFSFRECLLGLTVGPKI